MRKREPAETVGDLIEDLSESYGLNPDQRISTLITALEDDELDDDELNDDDEFEDDDELEDDGELEDDEAELDDDD